MRRAMCQWLTSTVSFSTCGLDGEGVRELERDVEDADRLRALEVLIRQRIGQ